MHAAQQEGAAPQEVPQDRRPVREQCFSFDFFWICFLLHWLTDVTLHSCKEYRNLNAFFAIVMGLSNPAVCRLNQTWEVSKRLSDVPL